jgi:endonuclease IV
MKHREAAASELQLGATSRKALTVHLGEAAGREVAELLQKMAERIERLERNKVDIMPVVSSGARSGAKSRRSA